jgi:LysM repeat protein
MDTKRTIISVVLFLAPFSFLVAQEKNTKNAPSVQSELEAIKGELKAQEEKLEQLAQEIAKLSAAIKENEANKATGEKSPSPTPPPKAAAVTPTPPPTAGVENPSPAEPAGTRSHVVAKGETLTQIAKQYGVTVEDIQQANKIQDAKKLQIGQTIKIPGNASPSPTPEAEKH